SVRSRFPAAARSSGGRRQLRGFGERQARTGLTVERTERRSMQFIERKNHRIDGHAVELEARQRQRLFTTIGIAVAAFVLLEVDPAIEQKNVEQFGLIGKQVQLQ